MWLDPSEHFQLRHRHSDWVAISFSTEEARGCGIPTIAIDGNRGVSEIVEDVAAGVR